MNLQSIREQLDLERRTLSIDGYAMEILPLVTRLRSADGSWHCVRFSSLSSDNADSAITRKKGVISLLKRLMTPFFATPFFAIRQL